MSQGFSQEDVAEVYKAYALKDQKARHKRLASSKLLILVRYGTLDDRVGVLSELLRDEVMRRRNSARQRLGLSASKGTTLAEWLQEAKEDFTQQDSELDIWSAVYFYRVCRLECEKLCSLLDDLNRYTYQGARRQIARMEHDAFHQLHLDFRDRVKHINTKDETVTPIQADLSDEFVIDDIPVNEGFIWRSEIDEYYQQLEQSNILAIVGQPGAGKTSIAAEIAKELQNRQFKVIWINVLKRFTLELLFEYIADGIGFYGDALCRSRLHNIDLGNALESGLDAERKFYSKINSISYSLSKKNYALVINDVHHLLKDDRIGIFIQKISDYSSGKLPIILTSREKPSFISLTKNLEGLKEEAINQMLRRAGIALDEKMFNRFYLVTQGLPKLVELVIAEIRYRGILELNLEAQTNSYKSLIDNLVRAGNVRDYLANSFSFLLSEKERRIMDLISIFRVRLDVNDEDIQDLIATLGVDDIGETLALLVRKSLIRYLPGTMEINCHDLISDYFYDTLKFNERKELHQKVAECHQKRDDFFETAYHWYKAGNMLQAAQVLVNHGDQLFKNGASASTLKDLQWFIPKLCNRMSGSQQDWYLYGLLGRAQEHLGEYESAADAYQSAITNAGNSNTADKKIQIRMYIQLAYLLEVRNAPNEAFTILQAAEQVAQAAQPFPDLLVKVLTAQAHILRRGLGQPQQAIVCGERALEYEKTISSPKTLAYLYNAIGNASFDCGRVEQATQFLEMASEKLVSLNGVSPRAKITVLNSLIAHHILVDGRLERAIELSEEAWSVAQKVGAVLLMERTLGNTGLAYHWAGDYERALTWYRKSLELSTATGHHRGKAIDRGNIGVTLYKLGQHDEARRFLRQSFEYFEPSGDVFIAYVASYLSFLSESVAERREYANTAWSAAQRSKHSTGMILAHRSLARAFPSNAVAHLQPAVNLATQCHVVLPRAVCAYELSLVHPEEHQRTELYQAAVRQFMHSGAKGWIKLAQAKKWFGKDPDL